MLQWLNTAQISQTGDNEGDANLSERPKISRWYIKNSITVILSGDMS